MTKRELKRVAQQIAAFEMIIQSPDSDATSRRKAQDEIIAICSKYTDIIDIEMIDEEVSKILSQKN